MDLISRTERGNKTKDDFTMRGLILLNGLEKRAPYIKQRLISLVYRLTKRRCMEKEFGDEECGVCPISFCKYFTAKGYQKWLSMWSYSEFNGELLDCNMDQFVLDVISQWEVKIGIL